MEIILITFAALSFLCCLTKSGKVIELIHSFSTDHLTQMYTRKIISKIEKNDNVNKYSVISVDIDHFKNINDTYGHYAGDIVIKTVAEIIMAEFKNKTDYCVRMGGEEFNIYMSSKDFNNSEIVLKKAETLLEKIRSTVIISDGSILSVTASIGCVYYKDVESFNLRQKKSDECLYKAKKSGRNKVVFYVD